MMRSTRLWFAVAGWLCLAGSHARAGLTAQVTLAGTSQTTVSINPAVNPAFSIDIILTVSPEYILSAEMNLTCSPPGWVEVTGGSYGPDWDSAWSLPIPLGPIHPTTAGRFGSIVLAAPGSSPRLTGTSRLITLNLQIPPETPPGTYTLQVSDLVIGEADTYEDIGGQPGTPFVITVPPPVPPPTVIAAVSRLTHGSAGSFEVDLLTPLPGQSLPVEPRTGGPTTVVVTFDQPVAGLVGLDPSDVSLTSTGPQPGTIHSLSITGNELTIAMSGTSDAARLRIAFPGIVHAAYPQLIAGDTLCLGVLAGDCTGNGAVNIFDLVTARNALGAAVGPGNFRIDVQRDGLINVLDMVNIRNQLNKAIPDFCP